MSTLKSFVQINALLLKPVMVREVTVTVPFRVMLLMTGGKSALVIDRQVGAAAEPELGPA